MIHMVYGNGKGKPKRKGCEHNVHTLLINAQILDSLWTNLQMGLAPGLYHHVLDLYLTQPQEFQLTLQYDEHI